MAPNLVINPPGKKPTGSLRPIGKQPTGGLQPISKRPTGSLRPISGKQPTGTMRPTQAHPGFSNVAAKIAAKNKVSKARASAILAASTRKASQSAMNKNPRLKRVPGANP